MATALFALDPAHGCTKFGVVKPRRLAALAVLRNHLALVLATFWYRLVGRIRDCEQQLVNHRLLGVVAIVEVGELRLQLRRRFDLSGTILRCAPADLLVRHVRLRLGVVALGLELAASLIGAKKLVELLVGGALFRGARPISGIVSEATNVDHGIGTYRAGDADRRGVTRRRARGSGTAEPG